MKNWFPVFWPHAPGLAHKTLIYKYSKTHTKPGRGFLFCSGLRMGPLSFLYGSEDKKVTPTCLNRISTLPVTFLQAFNMHFKPLN
jgi:hypothetical protein